jgi:hypothetical protein
VDKREAEGHIHALAASGHIFLRIHARRRKPEVGKFPLTIIEITFVLERGRVTEGPTEDIEIEGGWKFTMTRARDGHIYEVAGVFVPREQVVVITGFENKTSGCRDYESLVVLVETGEIQNERGGAANGAVSLY